MASPCGDFNNDFNNDFGPPCGGPTPPTPTGPAPPPFVVGWEWQLLDRLSEPRPAIPPEMPW